MLLSFHAYSQTQWSTSVDFGSSGSEQNLSDWVYDVITTSDGNLFAVGFGKESESGNSNRPEVPAFCMLRSTGTLIATGVVEQGNPIQEGRLFNTVEGSNGDFYAVGYIGASSSRKGVLVRVNKNTFAATSFAITPSGYSIARLSEIINFDDGAGTQYLILSGEAQTGTSAARQRWIATYTYSGVKIHEYVFPLSSTFDEKLTAIGYAIEGGLPIIYYAASQQVSTDGGFGQHRRHDSDIRVGRITYNPSNGSFTETTSLVNSILQGPRDMAALSGQGDVGAGTVFGNYPPNLKDKYPYGPQYLNTNFSRNHESCNEETGVNGYYIEDWSDGSEDDPTSLVLTKTKIVVAATLNRLIMFGGTNDALGNDCGTNAPGLTCNGSSSCDPQNPYNPCNPYKSGNYLWSEAYLLFFDKGSLALTNAVHIGTMSGGDFLPKVIKTSDGGFAVSGTVAGCLEGENSLDGSEEIMLIKLDAAGNIEYREHFKGPGEGGCGFAVTETTDGNFVVAGNTEGNGPNHEEDFCFIKFGDRLDCNEGQPADIVPNNGNDYVLSQDETWTTDMLVDARVVVPAGVKLFISGSGVGNTKITIRFSDSKATSDYTNMGLKGIRVEPGGLLYVKNAILTGYNCEGQERMWDGINVEGNPDFPQVDVSYDGLDPHQGKFTIHRSRIVNARQGTVASGMWYALTNQNITLPDGTQSVISFPELKHGGPASGGFVKSISSTWVDNKRSVIFMKYNYDNHSSFNTSVFQNNGPLVDVNEGASVLPGLPNSIGIKGTSIHASVWSTRISFDNCYFTGDPNMIPEFRPVGIEGDDPFISVTGGGFQNLRIGIECRSIFGGLTGSTYCTLATFRNVTQGINLKGSVGDVITNNQFLDIPKTGLYNGVQPTGIFGQNNMAGLFHKNEFHGVDNTLPSYGIVENNTLDGGALVKWNKFYNLFKGSQFEGQNAELTTVCNEYTDMGYAGFLAVNAGGSGFLHDQGESQNTGHKAYNFFHDACLDNNDHSHIYAEFPFNYYDKTSNPFPPVVDCVSDIVNLNFSSGGVLEECEQGFNGDGGDRLNWYLNSAQTLEDRNKALRELIHRGMDADSVFRVPNYEDAMAVLQLHNTPNDRLILTGTLAAQGRISEAQTELGLMNTTDAEYAAYQAYMQPILNDGGDASALSEGNYQLAVQAIEGPGTAAAVYARNLRQFIEGVDYPLIPAATEERNQFKRSASTQKERRDIVMPNPFTDELLLDLSGFTGDTESRIEVFNMNGAKVISYTAKNGEIANISTTDLTPGMYFYRVYREQVMLVSGKLIKANP